MSKFVPIKLEAINPGKDLSITKITATVNLKGVAADEFDALAQKTGLNRSQLLLQMVYHCLNKTEDLKDMYRRLAILGK